MQDTHAPKWQTWISKSEVPTSLFGLHTRDGCRRRPPSKRTTPAWSDGAQQCALGRLRRCCGGIWLPSCEDWTGDKRKRPTLNCRNTQSSSHQLHRVLVPVRQLEAQGSAETCPRSHSSLEHSCSRTLVFRLPARRSSSRSARTGPSASVCSRQREATYIPVSEAIVWRVVLSLS